MLGILTLSIVIGLMVWFVACLHRRAALFRSFAEVSQRYLGQVYTTFGGSPGASFRYRDGLVRLTALLRFPRNGGRQTRIVLDWPDRRFQFMAWTRGKRFRAPIRTGLSPYPSDQPKLTERFQIWTNDPVSAQALLSPACVWQLFQLTEMSANGHLYWNIRRGKCWIHVGGHFRRQRQLGDVVAKMLDLFSQAQLTQQQGLDFVDDQAARVIEEMTCPICSGPIGRDVVICVRCRTPHCKECWQYNGKCATFGCGSEKFAAPVADPAPESSVGRG